MDVPNSWRNLLGLLPTWKCPNLYSDSSNISISSQCAWPPDDDDDEHHHCQDQASDARIEVRAVYWKQLPADVSHHVKERRHVNALSSVVVEPDNDHALGHGVN